MNQDKMYRAMADSDQFRIFAVDSTRTVQHARDTHDLSPLATILLGRLISAAALLSLDLKSEEDDLSLRVDGEGVLNGALAIINGRGELRAYAFEPKIFLDEAAANFKVGANLLPGTLTISRNLKMKRSYTGTIELITGEIGDDLASYYAQSEQIPTAVNLGILIDPSARVRSSGAFMIQQLPGASLEKSEKIIANLHNTPNVSDLMDMGLSLPQILERFVLKDIDWRILDERELRFKCNCSHERFADALRLLGKEELSEMKEGIEPICHYCNTTYHFNSEDLHKILESL